MVIGEPRLQKQIDRAEGPASTDYNMAAPSWAFHADCCVYWCNGGNFRRYMPTWQDMFVHHIQDGLTAARWCRETRSVWLVPAWQVPDKELTSKGASKTQVTKDMPCDAFHLQLVTAVVALQPK